MFTITKKLRAGYATASLLALAFASQAQAQDAAPDAPMVEEEEGAIREIVVTAQKREESLQSVPVAVTAFDEKALDSATVTDLRDFAGRVPSLVVDSVSAGPSAAAISIRGISFEDI